MIATVQVLSPFAPEELILRHRELDRLRQKDGVDGKAVDNGDLPQFLGFVGSLSFITVGIFTNIFALLILGSIGFGGTVLASLFKNVISESPEDEFKRLTKEINNDWQVQVPKNVAKMVKRAAQHLSILPDAQKNDFFEMWSSIVLSCEILRLDPADTNEIQRIADRANAIQDARKAHLTFELMLLEQKTQARELDRASQIQSEIESLRDNRDNSDLQNAYCYIDAMNEAIENIR